MSRSHGWPLYYLMPGQGAAVRFDDVFRHISNGERQLNKLPEAICVLWHCGQLTHGQRCRISSACDTRC